MSNTSSGSWIKTGFVGVGMTVVALGVAYFGFWKPDHDTKVATIANLDSQVKNLTETKAQLETKTAELTTTVTTKTTELVKANTDLTEIRTRVGQLETEIATLSSAKAKTEKEKAELESKLGDVNALLKAARAELAAISEQNAGLKGQVAELNSRLDMAETKVVALTKQLEQTAIALKSEQSARASAEQLARDTELLRMAETQAKNEMAQMYKQLTPTRLEQRRETNTGKKTAQKKGVPLGFIWDGIGDAIVGTGEAVGGKNGPVYWVAIMPDNTEVRITDDIAQQWMNKGVPSQAIAAK